MGLKLLTGASGMIGSNLKELLPPMLCPTHSELDLTQQDKVERYLLVNNPEAIIHCASNDKEDCLFDNLRMFLNLAESKIPMITFCTGLEVENRQGKNGQYVLSKHIIRELTLSKYNHILIIKIWGCFGKYEKDIRFFTNNFMRVKQGLPILVRENKLFSYVYVKDLAKIIGGLEITNRLINIVGYTETLYDYAQIIKKVTNPSHQIVVESGNFHTSYFGKNDFDFQFTPLETAIEEVWDDFNSNPLIQRT